MMNKEGVQKNISKGFLISFCLMAMLVSGWIGWGVVANAANPTGIVTAESLNVRTGPAYTYPQVLVNKKSIYLTKNEKVTILATKGRYDKVQFTYKGKKITGYCCKEYIKVTSGSEEDADVEEDTDADAEEGTSTDDSKKTVKATPSATRKAKKVTIEEDEVPEAAVQTTNTKMVKNLKVPAKVSYTFVRVRTKASATSAQVKSGKKAVTLKKNKKVTILKQKFVKDAIWYYVKFKFNNKTCKGFVHSAYVTLALDEDVQGTIYSTSKVAVRNAAAANASYVKYKNKQVYLKNQQEVTITQETVVAGKKWFEIIFTYSNKEMTGYVLANQVAFLPETEKTTTEENAEDATNTTGSAVTATVAPAATPSAEGQNVIMNATLGKVLMGPLNVRVQAGKEYENVTFNGGKVTLGASAEVSILSSLQVNNVQWYYISFNYEGTTLNGYVMAEYVTVASAG